MLSRSTHEAASAQKLAVLRITANAFRLELPVPKIANVLVAKISPLEPTERDVFVLRFVSPLLYLMLRIR